MAGLGGGGFGTQAGYPDLARGPQLPPQLIRQHAFGTPLATTTNGGQPGGFVSSPASGQPWQQPYAGPGPQMLANQPGPIVRDNYGGPTSPWSYSNPYAAQGVNPNGANVYNYYGGGGYLAPGQLPPGADPSQGTPNFVPTTAGASEGNERARAQQQNADSAQRVADTLPSYNHPMNQPGAQRPLSSTEQWMASHFPGGYHSPTTPVSQHANPYHSLVSLLGGY